MVGLSVGDKKEIKVKFPDDYREKFISWEGCIVSA